MERPITSMRAMGPSPDHISVATVAERDPAAAGRGRGERMPETQEKRIAISSTGSTVDAEIDRHFSCCMQFLIIDRDGVSVLENTARGAGASAGPRAAKLLIAKGVTAIVTGNIGPKTFELLKNAGVAIHAGCSGKISEAIARCARNELIEVKGPTFVGQLI
jgi:predicted Fe-Mo cluster-binding NifX family protein